MTCPHCQSSKTRVLFRGVNVDRPKAERVPIIRCLRCGLVFSDVSHLRTSRPEIDFESLTERPAPSHKVAWLTKVFQKERQLTSLQGRKDGMILDVGNGGDGTFLNHLPPAWRKFAYETSLIGQEDLQASGVSTVDIFDHSLRTRFDLITLWHSFAHVSDPVSLLKTLHRLLREDGTLFISVPNFEGMQAQVFGPKWFHLDPSHHVFHYSPELLKRLLKENGFEVTRTSTASLEFGVFGWWQSLFNSLPLEFNMGYNLIENRRSYPSTPENRRAVWIYKILAIPVLLIAFLMSVIETLLGRGGVIQITAKKNRNFEYSLRSARHRIVETPSATESRPSLPAPSSPVRPDRSL